MRTKLNLVRFEKHNQAKLCNQVRLKNGQFYISMGLLDLKGFRVGYWVDKETQTIYIQPDEEGNLVRHNGQVSAVKLTNALNIEEGLYEAELFKDGVLFNYRVKKPFKEVTLRTITIN